MSSNNQFDAVIVGAGFAGLYMLYKFRELGLSAIVFERGSDVGGTWYWNRYPGARCDVESMEYSYQFSEELQQKWHWSERYSSQPEILSYAKHVAEHFDLRRDMRFETKVIAASFDSEADNWLVTLDSSETVRATFLVMATGCLSAANTPDFPGLKNYKGDTYHTGDWPHDPVDFSGKSVAIIGTGSSAIQSIPHIAEKADHLMVFQRTPNFSVPAANIPLDQSLEKEIKADYGNFRKNNKKMMIGFGSRYEIFADSALDASPEELRERFEKHWEIGGLLFLRAFGDLGLSMEANGLAAEFIRGKIRNIVKDSETAELLCPDDVVGCKRLCADTSYFETFNRENVDLVDVSRKPIDRITEKGIEIGNREYEADVIIFATGFDAMTGALLNIDIVGRNGIALREKWAEGPRTYLGLNTSGFPNLFTITGPGSPSVLSNMIQSIEQHVEFIADAISHMKENGIKTIEAEVTAEDAWVNVVNGMASMTLYPRCNSWYLGANVPGKPRVFMPYLGFPSYVEKCEEVVSRGYEGFNLSP
ncbi:MAG: NAD(P)/FAD-dependent oxidoreductase [Gammaproteobacteria bacterium]|nr:NAD(P)/FAD-dependent oxidoreductase [Gammaproteobacteria bacterium]